MAAVRVVAAFLCCCCLNGCIAAATYGAGTVIRGMAVGEDYAAWRAQMPAVPPGSGRIIVYPGGSRSFVYETVGVGSGGEQLFVVDRDVCKVLGHSFVYLDRSAGPHEVSAERVSEPFGYRKGRNKLELALQPGSVTYVKIEKQVTGTFTRSHYIPRIVPAAAAEAELARLPIDRDGLTCKAGRASEK